MDIRCQECSEPFASSQTSCPHCGRPSLFPNVTVASQQDEVAALESRYVQACAATSDSGSAGVRERFENQIRSDAKVVISVGFNELARLAQADTNVFSTFHLRVSAGLQIPASGKWDVLRGVAEHALFPGYKDQSRFGALSLDGVGVRNYGDCSIEIRDVMVTHRTSLFEDNNVVFSAYDQKTTLAGAGELECGHRARWADKEKLCVAKLALSCTPLCSPAILLDSCSNRVRRPEMIDLWSCTSGAR